MKKFIFGFLVATLMIAALLSITLLLGGCAPEPGVQEITKPKATSAEDYAGPYRLVPVGNVHSLNGLGQSASVYLLVLDSVPGNQTWRVEAVIAISTSGYVSISNP